MKYRKKGWMMFFLSVFLLLAGSESLKAAEGKEEAALEEMKLVAENEELELYFDEEETDIAIRKKTEGEIWFSNPIDVEEDTFSSAYYKKVLKSQIYLTYINEDTQISTMDNYTGAIVDGQFEVEYIENGIKVTYLMGESAGTLLLPEVITEERMLIFQEEMTAEQIKKLDRNYSINENGSYELRGGVKDYIKEELAGYFEEAGYTKEDYEVDMTGAGGESEDDSLWFQVPISYVLEGDNLVVTVNPEEISYNTNGYYLVSLDLLRYFGASAGDNGYLFVPDGSGALIYFGNGKTTIASYGASVYGQDETMISASTTKSQVETKNTVKMPVFGIKDGEKAVFTVIEQGDAYATINAEIAGKTTGYHDVYAAFSYLQYGETSLDDVVGANSYYMYSQAAFTGSYSLRYAFLTGEDADYSGMAKYYQAYLIEKGVLTERILAEEIPFYTEYIGAIDKYKTFFGVKYLATETLTTFEQAEYMTDLLREKGVNQTKIIYSGWMNGGLHGTAATRMNVLSKLEQGNVSWKEFLSDMKDSSTDVFWTLDLQYVYQNKLLDGYSTMQYAPRYFDNTSVTVQEYGLASQQSEGILANLISPNYVLSMTDDLSTRIRKKGLSGVNIGTVSWELFSDFSEDAYKDRQMALEENTKAIEVLKESGNEILGDNANAYVWRYATDLVNVPMYSNDYMILDEDVPFYEMVLHGYKQFAGEALNLADDYETSILKSVESGAGIQFKWIYEDNSILKETDFDDLYSVNYESWIEEAASAYAAINDEMGYLQGVTIQKHERVATEIVKVSYSDGSIVLVNYGDEDATIDGLKVAARNFSVKRGDGK